MNRNQWTTEEISYLKMSYFSGKRIKVIANELNRSEMGVNKALRRFNIRLQEDKKPLSSQKSKSLTPSVLPKKRIRELPKKLCDDWITIPKMITWMIENGINVVPVNRLKMQYKINRIPSTLGQLLLSCNRLRLSHDLPLFKVKGITNG